MGGFLQSMGRLSLHTLEMYELRLERAANERGDQADEYG